jgi:osmoprotectant transport system ATP-binding protein
MITFENVSVSFGDVCALREIDLRIGEGDLCVLVGPSGSGKSTLLRLVNRLVRPAAGIVRVRSEDVARSDPARLRRSIGYVIQSVGLFPHRSVAENIATVPRLLGWPKATIDSRVDEMLALVRLDPGHVRERRPSELSGGQAQRVGLARALAADPDLLLMDEPFGAVDPITRRTLRAELRRIHAETGKTVLLVTHDPSEALELATRLVVLRRGQIICEGNPAIVTGAGADPFVRELIGPRELVLRRLDLVPVSDVMQPIGELEAGDIQAEASSQPEEGLLSEASLLDALTCLLELRRHTLRVRSRDGEAIGSISARTIIERHP